MRSTPARRPSASSTQSGGPLRRAASVQSSQKAASQRNVHEFRHVERQQQVPKSSRRPRYKRPSVASGKDSEVVEVQDSDEDVENSSRNDAGSSQARSRAVSQEASLDQISSRFQKTNKSSTQGSMESRGLKRKPVTDLSGPFKQPRHSSPDPLTEEAKRTESDSRKVRTHTSSSESRRGEIKPTIFKSGLNAAPHSQKNKVKEPDNIRAQKLVGTGLPIKIAVSGSFTYPHLGHCDSDDNRTEPCLLCVHELSTILFPTNTNGEIMKEFSYLTIDLKRVHSITVSNDQSRCVMSIVRATSPEWSAGAKLVLEFNVPGAVSLFLKWVNMDRSEPVRLKMKVEEEDKLKKELHHQRHSATKTRVLIDSGLPRSSIGDDIKLMERQRETRFTNTQKPALEPETRVRKRKIPETKKTPSTDNTNLEEQSLIVPESPTTTATRTTRARPSRILDRSPTPKGWTEENPRWVERWRNSLIFPANGKNRATVDKDDITRLDEGQFLNDNLIIFGLRHLQDKLEREQPQIAQRIHFHNTFFYDKLKPSRGSGGINYDSVKGWTSKVDLFTKDFIVVPINEHAHWYVAIIYNSPKLIPQANTPEINGRAENSAAEQDGPQMDESPRTDDDCVLVKDPALTKDGPCFVAAELRRMTIDNSNGADEAAEPTKTDAPVAQEGLHDAKREAATEVVIGDVDVQEIPSENTTRRQKLAKKANFGSRKHDPNQPKIITLDSLGSAHSPACSYLRQYLVAELKDKKGIDIPDPGSLGMTAKGIQLQENYCDCGLYLLGYIQYLLQDPDSFVQSLLQYEQPQWCFSSSDMRKELRDLIFRLQDEQKEREDLEMGKRRQRKRQAVEEKSYQNLPSSRGQSPQSQPIKYPLPATDAASAIQSPPQRGKHEVAAPQDFVDASAMLRRDKATTDVGPGSAVGDSKIRSKNSSRDGATGELEDKTNLSDEVDLIRGVYPVPLAETGTRKERSGSDETTRNFLQPLKSPEGESPTNPVDLDSSPTDLTKHLRQNLESIQEQQLRATPRKRKLQSGPNTPRKSVEQPEPASSLGTTAEQMRPVTPFKPMFKQQEHVSRRTNIEVSIPSSKLKRLREAASTHPSGPKETGEESGYLPSSRGQQKKLKFSRGEYIAPPQERITLELDSD